MMPKKMPPKEALQALNSAAINGTLDVWDFIEKNFRLEGSNFLIPKTIKFESWQRENVLNPLVEKLDGRRRWDTYLYGLPKKNGKSTLAAVAAVNALLFDDPYPEVLGTAYDKDQARIIFNVTKKAFERSPGLRPFVKAYRDALERIDGNGVYRVIASDESGAHGQNPSAVFWDELWSQAGYGLWEALTHSPARANPFHFVTTYSGFQARSGNLLWDLYSRGLSGADPRMFMFWRSGQDANLASWITPEYIESQRRRLPDHIFRRLHYNEWSVAEDSKVFRIAPDCWQGLFQDPLHGSKYAIGVDLAKYRDYSAIVVLRTDVDPFRVVDFCKLPHADYTVQVEMLVAKIERFQCPNKVRVLVDAGAAGPAVIEMLRKAGLEIEEFKFTSESKAKIVTDLAVAFEQRKIILPQSGRTLDESRAIADLEKELFNFEPTILKSGNIRYAAAGAYHDDLVTALCLAYAGASRVPRQLFIPQILTVPNNLPPAPRRSRYEQLNPNDPGPSRWWKAQ